MTMNYFYRPILTTDERQDLNDSRRSRRGRGRFFKFTNLCLVILLASVVALIACQMIWLFTVKNNQSLSSQIIQIDFNNYNLFRIDQDEKSNQQQQQKRKQKCSESFEKMSRLFNSFGSMYPTNSLPLDYLDMFKANRLPIEYFWFIEHDFKDLRESIESRRIVDIDQAKINVYMDLIRNKSLNYNPQNDIYLESMLSRQNTHQQHRHRRSAAVIDIFERTHVPWIESLLILNDFDEITVIDCGNKTYSSYTHDSSSPMLRWIHLKDFYSSQQKKVQLYDVIVSHFQIEKLGLGRYGEQVSVNADLDWTRSMSCMLKPGGVLYLALSISKIGYSYVEYNVRRVYGDERLKRLVSAVDDDDDDEWHLIDSKTFNFGSDRILVLQRT